MTDYLLLLTTHVGIRMLPAGTFIVVSAVVRMNLICDPAALLVVPLVALLFRNYTFRYRHIERHGNSNLANNIVSE
jgi:hypothetical protein